MPVSTNKRKRGKHKGKVKRAPKAPENTLPTREVSLSLASQRKKTLDLRLAPFPKKHWSTIRAFAEVVHEWNLDEKKEFLLENWDRLPPGFHRARKRMATYSNLRTDAQRSQAIKDLNVFSPGSLDYSIQQILLKRLDKQAEDEIFDHTCKEVEKHFRTKGSKLTEGEQTVLPAAVNLVFLKKGFLDFFGNEIPHDAIRENARSLAEKSEANRGIIRQRALEFVQDTFSKHDLTENQIERVISWYQKKFIGHAQDIISRHDIPFDRMVIPTQSKFITISNPKSHLQKVNEPLSDRQIASLEKYHSKIFLRELKTREKRWREEAKSKFSESFGLIKKRRSDIKFVRTPQGVKAGLREERIASHVPKTKKTRFQKKVDEQDLFRSVISTQYNTEDQITKKLSSSLRSSPKKIVRLYMAGHIKNDGLRAIHDKNLAQRALIKVVSEPDFDKKVGAHNINNLAKAFAHLSGPGKQIDSFESLLSKKHGTKASKVYSYLKNKGVIEDSHTGGHVVYLSRKYLR